MKLVKNYLYNASYQLLSIIIPLLTIPYISRILGVEGVGINAYTDSIMSYFFLIANLGINYYGNRTVAYIRDDKKKLSQFFYEIVLFRFILVFFITAIYMIFVTIVGEKYKIFLYAQGINLIASFFDISWFFMGLEDFKKIFVRNFLFKILSVILIFTFVKTKNDVLIYIILLSTSTLVSNLIIWPYVKQNITRTKVKLSSIKNHCYPSIQFFLPQVAIQIYQFFGRTFLGKLDSVQALGTYESADKSIRIILLLITSISVVVMPRVANSYSKGDINQMSLFLKNTFDLITAMTLPMVFGLIGIADSFSFFFFGTNFNGIGDIIKILAFQAIFIAWSSVYADQFLIPTNKMGDYTKSLMIGTAANIILNIILIPLFGIYGACVTTCLTELLINIIQKKSIKQYIDIDDWHKNTPKYLVASLLMLLVITMMNIFLPDTILILMLKISSGIIVYIAAFIILKPTSLDLIKKQFIK